jgi:undecaprenyl-diphosphatase
VDWRLYKAIYDISLHHHWVGDVFNAIEKVSIPVMVIATVALWFLARPGGDRKWKLTAASALAAAAIAVVVDQVIYKIHDRARPYEAHRISHPWTSKTDPSFPSDHASASLAIAFAVLMFDPLVGALFLVAAVLIAVGRVLIGAHYPGDVGASLVVAAVAAFVVVRLGRPVVAYLVRLFERVSDPLVRPLWRSSRSDP